MKYRKKPVVIEAVKWTGENVDEVAEFTEYSVDFEVDRTDKEKMVGVWFHRKDDYAFIGDYIIKDVDGEFYSCKPDIFERTYEEVDESPYWYFLEYEYFICSECGEWVPSGAETTAEARKMLKNGNTFKYCPNCGARMGV